MTADECRALLASAGWGVLATTGPDGPYAVPVAYGLGDDCVYLATGRGTKRRHLERDGRACLTVCEVAGPDAWRSVVVRGRAEPVRALAARVEAVRALAAARARSGAVSAADARRLLDAAFFRLPLAGATGRARGG